MKINNSSNPAMMLGNELSKNIIAHKGDTICLLSGGSALDIIKYIDLPECRTIFMMGDERGSRETNINNTLQLVTMYPNHVATKSLIETIPNENEPLDIFANRIENILLKKFSELTNPKIFMILGIGTDGHTAGIFPMDKEYFLSTYPNDRTYVPVHLEGLKIDSRASLTPSWILNNVDELYVYAVGESKKAVLQSLLDKSKELHERPAELIKLHQRAFLYTDHY